MKHILHSIIFFIILLAGDSSYSQNIAVNTSGTAAASTNMFEVTQPSTTTGTVGIYSLHSGGAGGVGTGYGLWAEKTGVMATNIAAYLSATGGTNNYALIVPTGGGNVGIGTTTPQTTLHIADNTKAELDCQTSTGAADPSQISVTRSLGTVASPTAITNNTELGSFSFIGYDGTSFGDPSASIGSAATENFSATAHGGNLSFITTPNASIIPLERMRITESGLVGIGTGVPSTLLHLSINNAVTAATTNIFTLDHTSTGVAAVNFGSGINWNLENGAGSLIQSGVIENLWSNATAGSERSIMSFNIRSVVGITSRIRIGAAGVGIGVTTTTTPTNILELRQAAIGAGLPGSILKTFPGAHTNITAGTEYIDLDFDLNRTVQFLAGALPTQRAFLVRAPTYAFTAASTISDAATFAITGEPIAGANASISYAMALWVQAGNARFSGPAQFENRVNLAQGIDAASATNLILDYDANTFEVTGTTQIDRILGTDWANGSMITLLFSSSLTMRHGIATSGSNITILLAGAANFSATAGDTLTLVMSEIGGVRAWREVARAVI